MILDPRNRKVSLTNMCLPEDLRPVPRPSHLVLFFCRRLLSNVLNARVSYKGISLRRVAVLRAIIVTINGSFSASLWLKYEGHPIKNETFAIAQ